MIDMKKKSLSKFVLTIAILAMSSVHAMAQDEKVVDILPPTTQSEASEETVIDTTHPILRITPDKSELIRLEEEAGSIIIGNPLHVNVIADSSKTLVVVPRSPGATHFTVLSKKGEIIMQRHIIVASPKEDYIRVKRTCTEDSDNCQDTSVFYCPDMCHEIGLSTGEDSSPQGAASQDGGTSSNSSSSNGESEGTE